MVEVAWMLSNLKSVRFLRRIASQSGCERGLATVSLALFAFLATASTAATVTVAQGDVNFAALEELVDDSVNRVGATLEVRGSIIARSDDGATVDRLQLTVRYYGEGKPVPLDAGDPDRLVVAYYDETAYDPDVAYTFESITGNGDDILEPGEMALITIDVESIPNAALEANDRFTMELSAPVGGTVIVTRRVPMGLSSVTSLY
jgi:archaellin